MKQTTKRPKKLSKSERELFESTVAEMTAAGIDPAPRMPLVLDYVKLAARIDLLGEREEDPLMGNPSVSRALNASVAERRKLHAALFAGRRKDPPAPTPAEIDQEARQLEADTAWLQFYSPVMRKEMPREERARLEGDRRAWEAELERKYGPPDWSVLATPSLATAEQVRDFHRKARALVDSAPAV